MQTYEMTVITRQTDQKILDEIKKIIESNKAKIKEEKKWGEKTLSYPLKKNESGYYHQFLFESPANALSAIRKQLNFEEKILRFLIIKL